MPVPARLRPHEVTVVRAAETTDRYGNIVDDWANATRTTHRGWIELRSSAENTDDRETAVSTWLLVLPAGVDVVYTDRIEYGGFTFEIVSLPDTKNTPAAPHHIEAELRYTGW